MFNYYGVDWLIFLLLIIHVWMIGNKVRSAWLIGIVSYCLGIALAIMIESWPSGIMNAVFIVMGIRAYIKWGKDEA